MGSAAMMTEREMDKTMEHMPCQRHLRQGPVWMEDPAKAAALQGIKAFLKEDSSSCYICVARAAALNRIESAGGDSIKAAEDSESRVHSEVCVVNRVGRPAQTNTAADEPRPASVLKKTMKVRSTYLRWLLTGARLTPLRPLPDDYFEEKDEEGPKHRESMIALALAVLSHIDETDNILCQLLEKGYAMMELQIDYGN